VRAPRTHPGQVARRTGFTHRLILPVKTVTVKPLTQGLQTLPLLSIPPKTDMHKVWLRRVKLYRPNGQKAKF
jgi:hypothetical protein